MRHANILASWTALMVSAASTGLQAQPNTTASASNATPAPDDISVEDYLGLLAQISPAARDGAQAYLQAFQQRCGRTLTTMALRAAISQSDGDPILMGMMRASHPSQQAQRDATMKQLAQRIRCDGRSAP
jgi:aminopeptidase N